MLKEVLQIAGEKNKGNVGHEEGKKNNGKVKIWQNQFSSLLEFSKLYLMVEAKIVTLSEIIFNICAGNI